MNIFLNELSFCGQASNKYQGAQLMSDMLKVLKILQQISNEPIATSSILWKKEIGPQYSVRDYIFDRNIDQAVRNYFQIITTKGPYIEHLFSQSFYEHKCYLQNENILDVSWTSVAAAFFFDGILASLKGAPQFASETINVFCCLKGDERQEANIINQCDPDQADSFVRNFFRQNLNSGESLWEKRTVLFPEITFCEKVKNQLQNSNYSPSVLQNVIRHLDCMNKYMKAVRSGEIKAPNYTQMGIEASRESEITLKHFGHLRTFQCPDGKKRVFSWHSKIRGKANLRIYFYPPDEENEHFLIGYIGRHLPIWTER